MRATRQRMAILEELRRTTSHPTAEELYLLVKQHVPKLSLGTVYRNLELLTERGLIRKLDLAGFQRRFDAQLADHHHVRCIQCGRVADLDGHLPCCIEDAFQCLHGFRITGHYMELTGFCPECLQKDGKQLTPAAVHLPEPEITG